MMVMVDYLGTKMPLAVVLNICMTIYNMYGTSPTLEKKLSTGEKGLFKKKHYEADIVLGNQVWEVKPKNGKDPKVQLELYKKLGYLTEGRTGITILDNVKMRIEFPNPGEAIYLFYEEGNGRIRELGIVEAAIGVSKALLKSFPAGRRLAPGF